MRIEIPIPLPTWNQLLRMHWRTRSRINSIIKQFVSIAIQYESGLLTQTAYQSKLRLMESLRQEYCATITLKSSKKSPSAKKKAPKRKR